MFILKLYCRTWINDDENEIFVNESDDKDDFVYSDEEDSNGLYLHLIIP